MSDKAEAIAERIVRARRGGRDEAARLLEGFRSELLAAEQGAAGGGGDPSYAKRAAEQTLLEAAGRFSDFHGATEAELLDWLRGIMARFLPAPAEFEPSTLASANLQDSVIPGKGLGTTPAGPDGSVELPTLDTASDEGQVHQMETLAAPPAPAGGKPAAAAGLAFGDYVLLEVIAKGGMGVVYKARQKKLNRIVALKMILAGQFADERDVERFYVEAEAAANLRHPNIVAVHEVGEAEGQHYFSMDYVDGQSLASIVRKGPLSPRRAAQLVRTVAEAIEFAHRKGILHRDMKPSNILLDQTGQPLITDFGLAKRVGGQSHLTLTGTIVGTPSYMPPEQAAGKPHDAGPQSDVYSTGAMLFELLTGSPPFRAATAMETLQQVLRSEAPSPRLLNPSVPADLETVCLKCLQKEPDRRYQTSQELADELARYLAGMPILARPVSRGERVVRWCRRNPLTAGLVGAVMLAVMLAVGILVVAYHQTSAALAKAEEAFKQSLRSVDELFTVVSENELLNVPGLQPLRKRLLEKARDLYQELLAQQSLADDPAIRVELARSHFRLGSILKDVGSPREALRAYETARIMQERLLKEQPDNNELLSDMGNTRNEIGATLDGLKASEEALRWHEQALDVRSQLVKLQPQHFDYRRRQANSMMNVGLLHKSLGRLNEACDYVTQAQTQRREILRQYSDAPANAGELESLRRDLAKGYYNLGSIRTGLLMEAISRKDLEAAQHRLQETADEYRQAVNLFEQLLLDRPEDLENQYLLASSYHFLARPTFDLAGAEEAAAMYEKARQRIEPLAQANPDVHDYQEELAGLHCDLVSFLISRQPRDLAKTRESFGRAASTLRALAEKSPGAPQYRANLARLLRLMGDLESDEGRKKEAVEHLQASLDYAEQLVQQYPGNPQYVSQCDETRSAIERVRKREPKAPTGPVSQKSGPN